MSIMELGLRFLRDLVDEAIKLWQVYETNNPLVPPTTVPAPAPAPQVTTVPAPAPQVTSEVVSDNGTVAQDANSLFANRKRG